MDRRTGRHRSLFYNAPTYEGRGIILNSESAIESKHNLESIHPIDTYSRLERKNDLPEHSRTLFQVLGIGIVGFNVPIDTL